MKPIQILILFFFICTQTTAQHTFVKVKGGVFFINDELHFGFEPMIEHIFKEKHAIQLSYLKGISSINFAMDGGTEKVNIANLEYKYLFHKPKNDALRAYYISALAQYGQTTYVSGWVNAFSKSNLIGLGAGVGKYFSMGDIFSINPHIGFCVGSNHTKGWYETDRNGGPKVNFQSQKIYVFPRVGFSLGIQISKLWESGLGKE